MRQEFAIRRPECRAFFASCWPGAVADRWDISIFESGAILLYLGERSKALMPAEPRGRSEAIEWLFAALNSVEMASLPWSILIFSGEARDTSAWKRFDEFLKKSRLGHLELVLTRREWLAGTFPLPTSLSDVLRRVTFDG